MGPTGAILGCPQGVPGGSPSGSGTLLGALQQPKVVPGPILEPFGVDSGSILDQFWTPTHKITAGLGGCSVVRPRGYGGAGKTTKLNTGDKVSLVEDPFGLPGTISWHFGRRVGILDAVVLP